MPCYFCLVHFVWSACCFLIFQTTCHRCRKPYCRDHLKITCTDCHLNPAQVFPRSCSAASTSSLCVAISRTSSLHFLTSSLCLATSRTISLRFLTSSIYLAASRTISLRFRTSSLCLAASSLRFLTSSLYLNASSRYFLTSSLCLATSTSWPVSLARQAACTECVAHSDQTFTEHSDSSK